jgi:DNA-binding GntR family transcriptional regulator
MQDAMATATASSANDQHETPGQTREPRHRIISRQLTEQIEQDVYPAGSLLPGEVQLAQEFGVSRQTMRVALDALVRAGLLDRQRGKGTVVLRPRFEQTLSRFYSVAREMRQRGMPLVTQVLSRGLLHADDELAGPACEHLGIERPEKIGYLLRLRYVETTPLLIESLTFPVAVCPDLLMDPHPGEADIGAGAFYDALEWRGQTKVTRARETFRPVAVSGYEARLLRVPVGTPVFEVERTSFVDDTPVEWRRSLVRGDHYSYVVELLNPSEDGDGQTRHIQ